MIIQTMSEPLCDHPSHGGRQRSSNMGMDSQTSEQPGEEALLELGFGPDPPSADPIDSSTADAFDGLTDAAAEAKAEPDGSLESDIEADPSLVPAGASALLVAPAVLDPQEIEA